MGSFPDAEAAIEYLNGRIADERVQKRLQKILEERQRIEKCGSPDTRIPFPPGNLRDQKTWFEKLDREGIWELILKYLTDPTDLTNAYLACEVFRKVLEERRIMMLLPKVFGVLRDNGYLMYRGFDEDEDDADQSTDVLNQRLVSKAWKQSTEEEFLVPLELSGSVKDLCFLEWDSPMMCTFRNAEYVEKATNVLRPTSSCKSLIRMVMVNKGAFCDENNRARIYSKVIEFLDVHGEAVWTFSFHHDQKITDRSAGDFIYEALCEMVSKMPNLKALEVHHNWHGYLADHEYARAMFQEVNTRIQTSVQRRNFPTLPALDSVRFLCYPTQHEHLVAEVLKRNLNLKAVTLDDWDTKNGTTAIPSLVWDALRNLRLEYFQFEYHVPVLTFTDDFLRLREFNWPLKYFHLNYDYDMDNNEDEDYNADDSELGTSIIFNVLSRFNDTLEEFRFENFDNVRIVNDWESVVVDFPKLKDFDFPDIE